MDEGLACVEWEDDDGETFRPLPEFLEAVDALQGTLAPFLKTQPKTGPHGEHLAEFREERKRFAGNVAGFRTRAGKAPAQWERTPDTAAGLEKLGERFAALAEASHELAGQVDRLYKLAVRLVEICEKEYKAKSSDVWNGRDITRARKAAAEYRQTSRSRTSRSRCTRGDSYANRAHPAHCRRADASLSYRSRPARSFGETSNRPVRKRRSPSPNSAPCP